MTTPRVEIDLDKITQNTRFLVTRLAARGITVTGVTKAVCGHPDVARAMLDGGVVGLADARMTNIRRMRDAGITCPISMIRAPMHSEIEDVVEGCDTSYNTEIETIDRLAAAARSLGRDHHVMLVVEMGDMREGVLPGDLGLLACHVVATPGVMLRGLAANFACLGALAPTPGDMALLSTLADDVEGACGPFVGVVSGGSSANLSWALGGAAPHRTNNLRLGEAILLGVEPVTGRPIDGLHGDAFTLVAEVVETKAKPGAINRRPRMATLGKCDLVPPPHYATRSILALGRQDTDSDGLGFPPGVTYLGATSDHTVIGSAISALRVGAEMALSLNYSALMRAMSAPDVACPWRAGAGVLPPPSRPIVRQTKRVSELI